MSRDPANDPDQPAGAVPHGERRWATVLLADLSGYTRLNELLDPEEVASLMNRIVDGATRIVEAHGGIVNQVVGDEVKALFGVPVAHDDDPRRAVSAAFALHAFVRELSDAVLERLGEPLRLHTAINTGLLVTQRRDRREGRFGVTGDAMNTAARLLGVAGEDQIVVGPVTLPFVQPYFVTEALGSFSFRGKAEPLVVHRVREPAARTPFEAARLRGLSAYAGRDRDHAVLDRALQEAEAGSGGLVAVVGQAGLGKSRFFHEVHTRLDPAHMLVVQGRCDPFGSVAPYRPFLYALRDALGIRDDDARETVQAKVVAQASKLGATVAEHVPLYLHLLGAPNAEHPLPRSLQEDRLRSAILAALAAVLLAHCTARTVMLMLEDWHWADEASEMALRHVAALARQHRLLILVSYRPDVQPGWETLQPLVIWLRPLDTSATDVLVGSRFPGLALPDGLTPFLQERTGGNPFFLEELSRTLIENRALVPAGDALVLARPLDEVGAPETVQAAIRARIDRLPASEGDLLRLAAVLGLRFPESLLLRMAGATPAFGRALDGLLEAELLERRSRADDPEPALGFKHAITREVAYGTLLLQQRRTLHALAGAAIEELYRDRGLAEQSEALAEHFAQSGDLERASRYAELAGDKAATTFVLAQATRQYLRAIDLLEQLPDSAATVDRRVALCSKWGPFVVYDAEPAHVEVLRRTRERALQVENLAGAARCMYWMGWLEHGMGNHATAIEHFERARELAEALGDARLAGPLLGNLGQEHYYLADYPRAERYLTSAIELRQHAPKAGQDVGVANSLGYLALCDAERGAFVQAFARMDRALAIVRAAGQRQVEGTLLTISLWLHDFQGCWDGVINIAAQVRAIAEALGSPYVLGMALAVEGHARCLRDGDVRGVTLLRDAVTRIEARHMHMGLSAVYGCLAEVEALVGDPALAKTYATKAIARCEVGDRAGEVQAHRAFGMALARRGDLAAALERFEAAERVARDAGRRREEAITLLRHAEALREAGGHDAAPTLDRAAALFETMDLVWYPARARSEAWIPMGPRRTRGSALVVEVQKEADGIPRIRRPPGRRGDAPGGARRAPQRRQLEERSRHLDE